MLFFVSGSTSAHANPGGQLQEKQTTMTRRNDSYLPVPGDEKNLDSDFISKAKSGESVVRYCVRVISWKMPWCEQSIDSFSVSNLFPFLRQSLRCTTNPNERSWMYQLMIFITLLFNISCCQAFSQTEAQVFKCLASWIKWLTRFL